MSRLESFPHALRGFSLLESLVALALCGVFLSILLPTSREAATRLQQAERQRAATRLAANALSSFASFGAVPPLPMAGSENDLHWQVVQVGEHAAAAPGGRLLDLRITVQDRRTQETRVDFEARRLVFAP
jgi:prepilin-type N-terminal cleavage/methylation domain-containing protein